MTLEDRVQTAFTAITEIFPGPLLADGEANLRGVLGDLLGYTDGSFTASAPWHRRNRHGDKCISCQRAWPCEKAREKARAR